PVILSVAKDLKKVSREAVEHYGPEARRFSIKAKEAFEILRCAQDDRGSLVPQSEQSYFTQHIHQAASRFTFHVSEPRFRTEVTQSEHNISGRRACHIEIGG
ncbi:MAG: hypothetical protein M3437_20260, partial [Chloroflexota bacterium]|nr:hypothetical protein [Chloroflexota bacterium]